MSQPRGDLALVAVQLALTEADLAGERAFTAAISGAAAAGARAADGAEHVLLVFPEALGHFAPLVTAPPAARRQRTVAAAMAALATRRPLHVLAGLARGRAYFSGTRALQHAVLHAVGPATARLMQDVFGKLARRHRAWIAAGSHLEPVGHQIANTSYTFDPEGRLRARTRKVNLVPGLEDSGPGGLGLTRGDPGEVPVVDTPWGRLATLICYDGFSCPHTPGERFAFMGPRIDARGVHVIANPAANPWPWTGPWVHARPGDPRLRSQQWQDEGMPSTLARLERVRYAVTAHLCARLFDVAFDGRSEVLAREPGGQTRALARAASHQGGDAVVAHVSAAAADPRAD